MKTNVMPAVIATLLFAVGFSSAHAAENEKLDFAGYLEETLGHFHALELNLDDENAGLAIVHATHPIAELYDLMKIELSEHDPKLDEMMQETLTNLRENTVDVTREEAQVAIDEAREIIEAARMTVVGEELSNDPTFKLKLVKGLLETSAAEYAEAVENGEIHEMAEFQDGSAFVWRSQQIFDEIKAGLPEHEVEEIDAFYADLWHAYDERSDPSRVQTIVNGILHEIDEITGEKSESGSLIVYFENIEDLLAEIQTEYAAGNTDNALSLATKAYLDNYEFLEAPIAMHDDELMEEIEIMMREELRSMIRNGESVSAINEHIDKILEELEEAEELVLASEGKGVSVAARFANIEHHLEEVKEYYPEGRIDDALEHATKAYLDEYEYLESPIAQYDEELMEEIEHMLREELRDMINANASVEYVNSHIAAILEKLEEAKMLLPTDILEGKAVHEESEEHEEEREYADLPPLQQVEAGIEPEEVICDSGMQLLIKNSDGSPACVKPTTAERLIQLGWGTRP